MLPLILILGLIAFVAAAASYHPSQNLQNQTRKLPAAEYFQIINGTPSGIDYRLFQESNKTVLKFTILQFTIKAVMGPAHEVYVLGMAGGPNAEVGDLQLGQAKFVTLDLSTLGYLTTKDESNGKFPVTVDVTCVEAEGEITFYI